MALKELAGWNQTLADWRFMLEQAPGGMLGASQGGRLLGTAGAVRWSRDCGWISMVLVHPDVRRMGIGTRLMQFALERLAACAGIGLDATPAGRPLYRKLGFEDACIVKRLVCPRLEAMPGDGPAPARATADDLAAIVRLDAQAFGASREALARAMLCRAPGGAWTLDVDGRLAGFSLGRPGANYDQIGPVVAASVGDAMALVAAASRLLRGRPVVIDVPESQGEMLGRLVAAGFVVQRDLYRMWRGRAPIGDPSMIFAIAGPDLG
jgi:tRNA(Met) C34 N-acetyltransferase TmcA